MVPGEEPLPPGKLTRTRGPDLAASAARAEMVLAVLERSPLRVKGDKGDIFYTSEVFKNIICPSSAEGGHLEVLQWARAHGCPWNELPCTRAWAWGRDEVLQWAQGCPEYTASQLGQESVVGIPIHDIFCPAFDCFFYPDSSDPEEASEWWAL